MTSLFKDRIHFWKGALAAFLGMAVLIAGLAAIDGDFHQFVHGGDECEEAASCAIAMFDAGSVGASAVETVVYLPEEGVGGGVVAGEMLFIPFRGLRGPTARGPPGSFLFGR